MAQVKLDTENEQIGQKERKTISAAGDAEVRDELGVETVPGPGFESLAELEKFMNDELLIYVNPPMDEGEGRFIPLCVNGKTQYVVCGQPQKVKRKYVEVLARSRRAFVTAEGYKDFRGEAKNVVNINPASRFSFQVIEDPNRNGMAWLKKILAEN